MHTPGRGCRISWVGNIRSNMPTRYQVGLQDLTGSEHQIEHVYEVSGRTAGSHGFGTPNRTWLQGIRTGLQDLTDKKNQIEHAYKVSGSDCRIARVRYTRSYMPTRYGTAGSHVFGTTDPTCMTNTTFFHFWPYTLKQKPNLCTSIKFGLVLRDWSFDFLGGKT